MVIVLKYWEPYWGCRKVCSSTDIIDHNYLNFIIADALLHNMSYRTIPWSAVDLEPNNSYVGLWESLFSTASHFIGHSDEGPLIASNLKRYLLNTESSRFLISDTESATYMFMEPSELKKIYIMENEEQIIPYLRKQNELVLFMIEASKVIRGIFGHVQLNIQIKYDPEMAKDPTLYCAIYTDLSVDEALSKLNEFDETWFLSNISNAKGKVQFDVEWS